MNDNNKSVFDSNLIDTGSPLKYATTSTPEANKDIVEVVRCKYCRHYSDDLNDISGVCHLDIMARIRGPEDYCSKGKRK